MKTVYLLLFLPLAFFGQVPSYVPTNSLLAWYPFTGNANDLSGNGHNGTVNGATSTTDRYGNPGSAYLFVSSVYISVPDNPANFRPQNVSISVWALFTNTPSATFPTLISKNAGTGGSESATVFYYTPQSSWDANTGGPSYYNPPVAAPANPTLGVWTHLVYQFDGINSAQAIYMNGVLIATNTVPQGITYDASIWTIGAQSEYGTIDSFFPGKADDIGIWSRTLTPTEVHDLYCAGAGSFQTQPLSQTLTTSSNATFVAVSSGSASYQWQSDLGMGFQNLTNAGQYSGVTTSVLVVSNLTLGNNNQLFRCISTSTPCSATSNTAVLTVNPNVGISENTFLKGAELFPNPASDILTLKIKDGSLLGSRFEIMDVAGKKVMWGEAKEMNTRIVVSELSSGVYMFEMNGERKKILIK
jgi:hypothetical protein